MNKNERLQKKDRGMKKNKKMQKKNKGMEHENE